ncbi:MAG TPA: nucleoside hydrolase [Acidimicrobiales bacterium]|nr:nucleoside hydrolase [Acidimicrobiales bacterium]
MDVTRVVIDTDPGVDDAVAILLALASPELDVLALTTVAGNVSLAATTLNARRLIELAGRTDVIVATGSGAALTGPIDREGGVHGHDGLGDLVWDEPGVALDARDGPDVIWELLDTGPLSLVAIGPLTNLAVLLERHPEVAQRVQRVVVMGGSSFHGNVTPAAEFNVWADPEAAARVFAAPWPLTVMPLDLTHQATLNDGDLDYLRALGTGVGQRVADMLEPYAAFHDRWYGTRDVFMHDAMAVYELIDPTAISKQGAAVEVETRGDHSRGATWFDRRLTHAQSSVRVGVTVDNGRFVALVRERLALYP